MLVESLLLIKKHKKKPWLNLLLISGRLHKDIFLAQRLAEKILAWVKEESSGFKNPKYTTHLERDASGKLI